MADAEQWILVVEDDPGMRDVILIPGLEDAGFNVVGAGSAAEAYRSMLTRDFSLFVLDVGLPDEDGFTIVKHLRPLTDAGIVMLTGRGRGKADRIRGLNEGADVYLSKPIDIDELTATVRSLLRRLRQPKNWRPEETLPGWQFDMESWNLASPMGAKVRLTHAERLVVSMLAASFGETVARDTIISRLAKDIHDFDPHRLEMLIHRLRRKVLSITNEHLPLNAVRGVGYVLLEQT
jgi:two-component system, OmpR family, response regulator PhoP